MKAKRAIALFLDVLVVLTLVNLIINNLVKGHELISLGSVGSFNLEIYDSDFFDLLVLIVYFTLVDWRFRGKSLGKALFGLEVLNSQGLNLSLSQAIYRNIVKVLSVYLIFGIVYFLVKKGSQPITLHDKVVGSRVFLRKKAESSQAST